MTKIIVPTGYMGSGSSAVGDLLREYDNINVDNKDFEYILCICLLEYLILKINFF